ncbi:MAG: CocE/NonD family hydrolase [Fimbriimonadaceae bacterium]
MKRLLLLALVLPLPVFAQEGVRDLYTKQEVSIPMRDGKKLFTSIYIPKDKTEKWPFLMVRTPYSVGPYGADAYRTNLGPDGSYGPSKFIFVFQDVRGRYMSEGDFKWMTPFIPNKKPGQVDESTDTRDTIDWLLKNVANNNGRVGMVGTSFPGHYVAQALIDPHPALVCASPQAPMADNWLGDDMHHNGAFFLPHAFGFITWFNRPRTGPTTGDGYQGTGLQPNTQDGYRFYLEAGPLSNLKRFYTGTRPIWDEWMTRGDYDAYWQAQNVPQHLKSVGKVAVMTVGGWFDAEDLQGPLSIYQAIEKNNPQTTNTLVMGPWYHGSWNGGPGDSLHDIKWTTKTSEDFRKLQMNFFNYHLKGKSPEAVRLSGMDIKDPAPEAVMFDVGADKWRIFDQWPPASSTLRSGYFNSGPSRIGTIAPAPKTSAKPSFDEYVSDPSRTVPNSATITTGMARSYMLEDQRFVWTRPDVLSYESPVFTTDTTFVGPVTATLYVSSTGSDADFIVKLIDVFPNDYSIASPRGPEVQMGGYQMMVRGEPMRAKYRNSWSKPEPLRPGKIEKVQFVLPDVCHTFKKGHKMMVQIQSSWFPLIDRNPQKFINIYKAKASDFQRATQRIYLSGKTASRITAAVLK